MAETNSYNPGTLNIGGRVTPIALAWSIHSDDEINPPSLLKRLRIKDEDKNYHFPEEVDGKRLIGFEDQWARGWSHHGYYSLSKHISFIPFHFLGIENDNYSRLYLPSLYTNDGGKKWRVDFYKKEVVKQEAFTRIVRFTVKGHLWIHTNLETKVETNLFDFKLFDSHAEKCIQIFAGKGISIDRFHWNKEVLEEFDGWRPCLVREDLDEPFYIEYNSGKCITE